MTKIAFPKELLFRSEQGRQNMPRMQKEKVIPRNCPSGLNQHDRHWRQNTIFFQFRQILYFISFTVNMIIAHSTSRMSSAISTVAWRRCKVYIENDTVRTRQNRKKKREESEITSSNLTREREKNYMRPCYGFVRQVFPSSLQNCPSKALNLLCDQ